MRGRWRYRLLQASPLIVGALIVLAWFSLPLEARSAGLTRLYLIGAPEAVFAEVDDDQIQLTVMEAIERSQKGLEPWESSGGSYYDGHREIDALAGRASYKLGEIEPAATDEYGEPRQLSDDELAQVLEDIEAFERENGAAVVVWALPAAKTAPVALSAMPNTAVLLPEELAEYERSNTIEAIRRVARQQQAGPLMPDVSALNGGQGERYGERYIGVSTLVLDGRLWESYVIASEGGSGEMLPGGMWTTIEDPALEEAVSSYAEAADGCGFVVGPIDADPVLIRAPSGMSEEVCAEVWEGILTSQPGTQALWQPVPVMLEKEVANAPADLAEVALGGTGRAPRVALMALYNTHPRIPDMWERIGRSPATVLQVWVGTHFTLVLGALAVLFLTSLVASPLAFRAERLFVERVEVERERERVQRETELRVVERLNELSARMDAVIARASETTAADVSGVSEDIESTIAELRAILGSVMPPGEHHD